MLKAAYHLTLTIISERLVLWYETIEMSGEMAWRVEAIKVVAGAEEFVEGRRPGLQAVTDNDCEGRSLPWGPSVSTATKWGTGPKGNTSGFYI
jgi:hypothetical protein